MARKRVVSGPIDPIEADFLEALRRLGDGRPNDKRLRELHKRSKLKLNISNVALEAGRSRTLIALESCRYPRVRELVLLTMSGRGGEPQTSADLIDKLREDLAVLRTELKKAEAVTTSHFIARKKAEAEAARWHDIYERSMKRQRTEASKVVSLVKQRD